MVPGLLPQLDGCTGNATAPPPGSLILRARSRGPAHPRFAGGTAEKGLNSRHTRRWMERNPCSGGVFPRLSAPWSAQSGRGVPKSPNARTAETRAGPPPSGGLPAFLARNANLCPNERAAPRRAGKGAAVCIRPPLFPSAGPLAGGQTGRSRARHRHWGVARPAEMELVCRRVEQRALPEKKGLPGPGAIVPKKQCIKHRVKKRRGRT